MKLNLDCIRDVLLTVEKCQQIELSQRGGIISHYLSMKDVCSELSNQLPEDIVYSVIILNEAGYIDAHITSTDSIIVNFRIYRLTYKGHEFLDEIRDGKIYSEVKKCLGSVGSFGLALVSDVAKSLLGSAVSAFFAAR